MSDIAAGVVFRVGFARKIRRSGWNFVRYYKDCRFFARRPL